MANSAPELRQELLDAVGVTDAEELFVQIPEDHRLKRPLDLPPALPAEADLQRHLTRTLRRNVDCEQALSFLGGGVWQHHVPAVCDELAQRTEFVTSEWGTPASDHGRNQAWFEFASQLGELLELDFAGLPVYSWGCAAGHAIRMAARMTDRDEVLVPANLDPERAAVIRTYCEPPEMASHITVTTVGIDPQTGRLDLGDLASKLSERTAAVYLETPNSHGVIETEVEAVAQRAHDAGAELILGVDPLSLGVLASPAALGADIATGPLQPLGVPLAGGGGCGGFLASLDTEALARTFPTLQVSAVRTNRPGEIGFALTLFAQTSYGARELGNDWTGNSVYLWTAANAAYLSLLGPAGLREVGETILDRSHAAARALAGVDGVDVPFGAQGHFKEFVVTYRDRTVAEVNEHLLSRGIFGGHDLAGDHPTLGQAALFCVTEVHDHDDLGRLVDAVREAVS
jgi:glycine dehydrogenase subunit 1